MRDAELHPLTYHSDKADLMHDTALAFGKLFFDTYLPEHSNLTVIDVGATAGSWLVLKSSGDYQPGLGSPDTGSTILACFVDSLGQRVAPEAYIGYYSTMQSSGLVTDVSQDFRLGGSGYTQVLVPSSAVALLLTPNDSFFGDNTDPDNDFGVWAQVRDSSVDEFTMCVLRVLESRRQWLQRLDISSWDKALLVQLAEEESNTIDAQAEQQLLYSRLMCEGLRYTRQAHRSWRHATETVYRLYESELRKLEHDDQ